MATQDGLRERAAQRWAADHNTSLEQARHMVTSTFYGVGYVQREALDDLGRVVRKEYGWLETRMRRFLYAVADRLEKQKTRHPSGEE